MTDKIKKIQAIRGMNDLLPEASRTWQFIENKLKQVVNSYGYNEIRPPIVEETALFKRAVGEVTDIVEKEMYTFNDRNDESLTLRPEITAGCVRAGIEHGLFYNQEQRFWYYGPAFRYERPQKGRYRQFYQMGVEVFGLTGPDIDAELILMTARFWKMLGISEHVTLELNTIGSTDSRAAYRTALIAFLEQHKDKLDEDCLRRMYSNPLRVLDSKNPEVQQLLNDAPQLFDYLDDESRTHFAGLCHLLDNEGVAYQVNQRLVRGLDYYNRTVFEWVTRSLGAQGTVCGGGRYDGLVNQLGGQQVAGVGFAMGFERLVLLVQTVNPDLFIANDVDVYVIASGENTIGVAQRIAEMLRDSAPNLRIMVNYGGGNFKKQFSRADKYGAQFALVIGDNEVANHTVVLKDLKQGTQVDIKQSAIASAFLAIMDDKKGEIV